MKQNSLTLHTKRLIVRPLKLSDFKIWKNAHLEMNPKQNSWDQNPKPVAELTLSYFKKLITSQRKKRKADSFYDLAVFEKKPKRLVGWVSLMDVSRGLFQNAYLGYRISNLYWGLGYGKEATQAAIQIGLKQLKLHRIEAGIEAHNHRSIRLVRSLNFRKEGVKKRALYLREKWIDIEVYALTCEEMGIKWNGKLKNRLR